MVTRLSIYRAVTILLVIAGTSAMLSAQQHSGPHSPLPTPAITAFNRRWQSPDECMPAFIENRGQWDSRAKFLMRTRGLDMWLTDHSVLYDLYRTTTPTSPWNTIHPLSPAGIDTDDPLEHGSRRGHVIAITFEGASFTATTDGIGRQQRYYNYFIGDRSNHATDVPLYSQATIQNLYHGIDALFYLDNGQPRYDLLVEPGSDPQQIRMKITGAEQIEVTPAGALAIATTMGMLEQQGLYAYQMIHGRQREVDCRFVVEQGQQVGFAVGDYDRSYPLVIDPLVYSTVVGENGNDVITAIAVDSSGNTYVTGYTYSPSYPVTEGAYDKSFNGVSYDMLVSRFNSTGSNLVYSTFIGGNSFDLGASIAVDQHGNAYIAGNTETSSLAYPTTPGAYDQTANGFSDAVVTKLNSTGNVLLYSTFLGSSLRESAQGIAIDSQGNAYLTGITGSIGSDTASFPTSVLAYDQTRNGMFDCFAAKLDSSGSTLLYSTLIGGANMDGGQSIAADASGNAYITGYTASTKFPTTPDAFDISHNGSYDLFVTKLNDIGSTLLYSTYLGGDTIDQGYGIAVGPDGNAYVVGSTRSSSYPTTSAAYDISYNGAYDVVVTRLNSTGSSLVYSTFIGGDSNDYGYGIALDRYGSTYVTGSTSGGNTPYPTTPEAYDEVFNGGSDLFLTRLRDNGNGLLYSTYMGGSGTDVGYGITVDRNGNAYLAGYAGSGSPAFPTTTGAFDGSIGDASTDGVVVKFEFGSMSGIPEHREVFDFRLNTVIPNPAKSQIQVDYVLNEPAMVSLEIFSGNGEFVAEALQASPRISGSNSETIRVGDLVPGAYILQLTVDNRSITQRFVVLR